MRIRRSACRSVRKVEAGTSIQATSDHGCHACTGAGSDVIPLIKSPRLGNSSWLLGVLALVPMGKCVMTTYRAGYDYVPSDTLRAPIPDLPNDDVRPYRTAERPRGVLIVIGLLLLLSIGLIYASIPSTHP
jgi:hypothetical protein